MPGKQIRNWSQYHRLRAKGFSKSSAARITNAKKRKRGGRRKR